MSGGAQAAAGALCSAEGAGAAPHMTASAVGSAQARARAAVCRSGPAGLLAGASFSICCEDRSLARGPAEAAGTGGRHGVQSRCSCRAGAPCGAARGCCRSRRRRCCSSPRRACRRPRPPPPFRPRAPAWAARRGSWAPSTARCTPSTPRGGACACGAGGEARAAARCLRAGGKAALLARGLRATTRPLRAQNMALAHNAFVGGDGARAVPKCARFAARARLAPSAQLCRHGRALAAGLRARRVRAVALPCASGEHAQMLPLCVCVCGIDDGA